MLTLQTQNENTALSYKTSWKQVYWLWWYFDHENIFVNKPSFLVVQCNFGK